MTVIDGIVNETIRRLGPAMKVFPPRIKVKELNRLFEHSQKHPENKVMEPTDLAMDMVENAIKAGYTCGLLKALAEILTIVQEEGNTSMNLRVTKDNLVAKLIKYDNTAHIYRQAIGDVIDDIIEKEEE